MLTKLIVRNFKCFGNVEIELANPVIFIGPNNSGKTSALQALALWETGLKRWVEKRGSGKTPLNRPGVTINRRDLVSAPVPSSKLLWRDIHVRARSAEQERRTQNIRIDIVVEGITNDRAWRCGLEFDYANEQSFYCRPLRLSEEKDANRMEIPDEAREMQIAFLPPMSGLMANEVRLDPGAINVRVGEGRTAEVLRNLCYKLYENNEESWEKLNAYIKSLFGSTLNKPEYIPERGEIEMSYLEKGVELDISCSGRGLQQTLLLLSYMYANPNSVLLLDEPDAHLEILRQRQIYQNLIDVARENGNQIIAASHSEVLLNEAADRDAVVAFVGKPHLINGRGSQVLKALRSIGFDQYYQAEQTGWVLYLEGSTDLAILRSFAKKLEYEEAIKALERPFVHYVSDQPGNIRKHFYGLREAVPNLKGVAIFDRLKAELPPDLGAEGFMWRRREIENYLCYPETLEAYARSSASTGPAVDLFSMAEAERRLKAMQESIQKIERYAQGLHQISLWDESTKVSDLFLARIFAIFFQKLSLPNVMAKKNFHELAHLVPLDKLDPEIREKLDAIVRVAKSAEPIEILP